MAEEASETLQGPRTGLRFEVDPPEAEIIIDEQSYGAASSLPSIALPPGIYRVSVKARGYTTWRAEVAVGNQLELLKVSLPKRQ